MNLGEKRDKLPRSRSISSGLGALVPAVGEQASIIYRAVSKRRALIARDERSADGDSSAGVMAVTDG